MTPRLRVVFLDIVIGLFLLGFLAFALYISWGCSPAPAAASVDAPALSIIATGDTLTVTASYHRAGTLDSIIWTVRDSQAVARQVLRRSVALNGTSDSVSDVPLPVLADGGSVQIASCFTGWIRAKPTATRCRTAAYTRPGVLNDSLIVVGLDLRPSTATLALRMLHPGDTIQFCTFARMKDGRRTRTAPSLGPACDALWASYQTEAHS